MRTRTLLLLAIGCGLAILLAGGIQLWRISNQDETTLLAIGDTGHAGEANVKVVGYRPGVDGFDVVDIALSGVDDPQGLQGFSLRAPGDTYSVSSDRSTCVALTVEPSFCELAFAVARTDEQDRQLVFTRGGETVVWDLVP